MIKKNWFGQDVIKYHRNFEYIINTLVKNNFTIDKIIESKASDEAIIKNPKYVNQWDRPYYLFVRVLKK